MFTEFRLLLLILVVCLTGCASPIRAARIASASTSHLLCSTAFVSGMDADQAFREEILPEAGMGLLAWAVRYQIDREKREVRTRIAGRLASRAVYREGLGCIVDHHTADAVLQQRYPPDVLPDVLPVEPPATASDELVRADDKPELSAALDAAFDEPRSGAARNTKAVVVMHHGQLIAERYAPGVAPHTPLNGHSMTKSFTTALVGVMVQQGRWSSTQAKALEPWMRMSSGLSADEYAGGFDPATRMWFDEPDMAAFAAAARPEAAPDTVWHYSDRGYLLVSRALRDAHGGQAATLLDFAHRELFGPLGMANVTLEFDGTGTPVGDSRLFASARDWARFGQLYLNDGKIGQRRLLPEGWVAASRKPTLDAGYGMGFWLNNRHDRNPFGGPWGMSGAPADAYFARGYLGQFVVIVPSLDLVVVRLGVSHRPGGDIQNVGQLVASVASALR